jgi:hypothetical protein
MDPFQRLSRDARVVLDLASRHAVDGGRREIDTGDLAWALLRRVEGGAAVVLARLRVPVEPAPAPETAGAQPERRLGVTARMRDAVRRAYDAAARDEASRVGSEHLLLGLLEADPGARDGDDGGPRLPSASAVRAELAHWRRRRHTGWVAQPLGPAAPRVASWPRAEVRKLDPRITDGLRHLDQESQLRAAAIILHALGGRAQPPMAAMDLTWELEDVEMRREVALRVGAEEEADRLADEAARLRDEVQRALGEWHAGLRAGGGDAPGGAAAPH